jgi:hypothetical protein
MTRSPWRRTAALSPTTSTSRLLAAAGAAALVLGTVVAVPALAAHPEVSLAGSEFEIDTNANLALDDASPSIDWATVDEVRKADKATGSGDDSFGQGSKEDTEVPAVVDGSIPPNKSDLKTFGLYLEKAAAGDFLHLYWHRVQDPSGTTNMDFEFNKSETTSGNGVTPVRTEGDVLIQYDLSQGGTNPQLFVAKWLTDTSFNGDGVTTADCVASNQFPCWGLRDNLTAAGDATGSINTTPIAAGGTDGLGAISARTFGEATVDFTALGGGTGCTSFGSAYLKSRSSDSFTAAMKDFIAPTATGLNNCGALKIVKTKKHAATGSGDYAHAGVSFSVTGPSHPGGTTAVTGANGVACLSDLEPGAYTVSETVPAGYAVTTANPQVANVVVGGSCTDPADPVSAGATVTFANMPLTDLTVSVDSQVAGGTFSSIDCEPTASDPDVGFNGDGDGDGDDSLTLTDLLPGTYTCTVVIDP